MEREIANLKKDHNQPPSQDLKGFKNIDYTQTRFHTIKTTAPTAASKQQHQAPSTNIFPSAEASSTNSMFVPKSAMITQKLNELQIVQKNNQQIQEELQRQQDRAQREQQLQQEEQRK